MKTITREDLNLYIEIETYRRFENLIRGYKVANGEIEAFLGKYIVPTNYTEHEVIELFYDEWTEEETI